MGTITTVIISTNTNTNDIAMLDALMENPKEYSRCMEDKFICIDDEHPNKNSLIDSSTYIGSFIYLDEERFRQRLHSLPWEYPADVQVFVKTEHDDRYRELDGPSDIDQSVPFLYDPADGADIKKRFEYEPVTALQYREMDWGGAWLYDPWTGKQRNSYQVKADMFGRKIVPVV